MATHAPEITAADLDPDAYSVDFCGNTVFFYGEVSQKSSMRLAKVLREVSCNLMNQKNPVIYLHVQSEGGDLYAGLSAMDHITSLKVPVHTVVDGLVASAATFITLAGEKRYIMPHGFMHIHQLSTSFWGKYEEMVDDFKQNKRLMKLLKRIYMEKTSMKPEQVNELLSRESTLNSSKVIKLGLAEELYT